MSYIVTAPLVVAANPKGNLGYHYRGQMIGWLDDESRDRLVSDGMIEEFAADEVTADDPPPTVVEEATVSRPAQTAPKPAWVEYAISKGWSADDAEAATKADLISGVE